VLRSVQDSCGGYYRTVCGSGVESAQRDCRRRIGAREKLRDRIDRQEDILFYEVIEDIIEDEQEHREELSRLQEG
jgi:hypothetical protein